MGKQPNENSGELGHLVESLIRMVVSRASVLLRGYLEPDAGGGRDLQGRGLSVALDDE